MNTNLIKIEIVLKKSLLTLLILSIALSTQRCKTFAGADPLPSVWTSVANEQEFSTFKELLVQTGWSDKLMSKDANYTLFAPVNSAFTKLGQDKLNSLKDPANRASLQAIIENHIFQGTLEKESLVTNGTTPPSVSGKSFPVKRINNKWYVGNAHPTRNPVYAKNGMLYVVEDVIQ